MLITMVVVMRTVGDDGGENNRGKNYERMEKEKATGKRERGWMCIYKTAPYFSVEISKLPMVFVLCQKKYVFTYHFALKYVSTSFSFFQLRSMD